jgi:hypothetical protein
VVLGEFERRADIDDLVEIAQPFQGSEQVLHDAEQADVMIRASDYLTHPAAAPRGAALRGGIAGSL